VAVRSIADVERVRDVPPASFMPEPAVASSIIRMHPARPMPEAERTEVLRLARAAFQLRRKTLRHGLGRALDGRADLVEAVLAHCGVDPGRRPETLDLDEWRCLARAAGEMG
jgi:16S rRNA (adenine1518-N6/adenine1519-N6)-dimethyltransferase